VMGEQGLQRLSAPRGFVTMYTPIQASLLTVWYELLHSYPTRTLLGATLMVTQSFLYNSIFFTYALILSKFYGIEASQVGLYLVPFAIGNFFGPLLLGRFFDSIGRRRMIAWTYALSGSFLALTGYLFWQGTLTALTQTLAWCVVFFFASAGASAAYLTVSELFPLEIRASAIGIFFVLGQGVSILGPWLFSHLIETSARGVFFGDLIGAGGMLIGAIVALRFGVNAEHQPLEQIAPPLSCRARAAKPDY